MSPTDCSEECSSANIPKLSDDRLCRVCSDRSDGAHFGIDSCRACAAFFRRSVVTGKKYVCRQGGNDCEINKSIRCMCRKCRLRKCLEAGMLPENVQNKRDPIIQKSTETPPIKEGEMMRSSNSAFTVVGESSPIYLQPQEIVRPPEPPHLLYKILNQYKQLCAVRKATEMSMDTSSLKTMFSNDGPMAGLSQTTCTKVSNFYRAHLPAIGDFAASTFEEFNELDQEEKWLLFQSFVVIMWGMEGSYRTYKRIPPEQFTSITILTETTYLDINNIADFLSETPGDSKLPKDDLIRLLTQCMGRPRQKMVWMMYEMQITDEEYAALLGLMLWNQNIEKGTDRMENLSKQMRAKIFEQLHLLYTMNNMSNYAERLGELMCLYSAILQYVTLMKEFKEILYILDFYKKDPWMYQFAKGDKPLNEVVELRELDGQWKKLAPMNNLSGFFAAAVWRNEIYAIGGYCGKDKDKSKMLKSVEIFDGKHWRSHSNTHINKYY